MPSKSAGKIITKVDYTKNGVSVFLNEEKVNISKEAFTSSFLYVGKSISQKEIDNLKRISTLTKSMDYAFSLLKKRHYTEWKMREKLYQKELSKSDTDYIIKRLKDVNLIDDRMFSFDLIEYLNEKCYGKNKIIQHLKDEGVFNEEINKLKFPESLEMKKALHQLKNLEKKYQRKPYEKRKILIYQSLLLKGFDVEVANRALNNLKAFNKDDDLIKLKRDYSSFKKRLSIRYENEELINKIFKALRNKGYQSSDIKKIMEDSYDY